MRPLLALLLTLLLFVSLDAAPKKKKEEKPRPACLNCHTNPNAVYVDGYTRPDGTYVKPYYRSKNDRDPNNNWSHDGNRNPKTGKPGTKKPKKTGP